MAGSTCGHKVVDPGIHHQRRRSIPGFTTWDLGAG